MSIASQAKVRERIGGEILANRGLLTKRDLRRALAYAQIKASWGDEKAPRLFSGTVYVDGSGAMCRSHKAFSKATWATVIMSNHHGKIFPEDRTDLWKQYEERDVPSQENNNNCACKNDCNVWHKCGPCCADNANYNGRGKRRRAKKKHDGENT